MKKRRIRLTLLIAAALVIASVIPGPAPRAKSPDRAPLLIAHRGASAYAPEHTLASYRLAIEQRADFVEQDLQMTRDGVLICLHDPQLQRTTNVAEVFPNRSGTSGATDGDSPNRSLALNFTLEEVKQLDAGSWFNRANPFAAKASYSGERVPTLEEAIKTVGSRAGLYIELKNTGLYRPAGLDMVAKLARTLDAHGFNKPANRDRIFIQSFSRTDLVELKKLAPHYRRVQLLPMEEPAGREDSRRLTPELAKEIAGYADGIGPAMAMITPAGIAAFHQAGLLIHPYTFRGPTTAVKRQPLDTPASDGIILRRRIVDEMRRFIALGVDGGFTDYPDLWREALSPAK